MTKERKDSEKVKVVIYIRKSSTSKADRKANKKLNKSSGGVFIESEFKYSEDSKSDVNSILLQSKLCKEYVKKNNEYNLVAQYYDNNVSGSTGPKEREGFDAMVKYIRSENRKFKKEGKKLIHKIIIKDSSRYSRSLRESFELDDVLEKLGVDVEYVRQSDNFSENVPVEVLKRNVMRAVDQYEKENSNVKQQDANFELKMAGYWLHFGVYGLEVEDKMLSIPQRKKIAYGKEVDNPKYTEYRKIKQAHQKILDGELTRISEINNFLESGEAFEKITRLIYTGKIYYQDTGEGKELKYIKTYRQYKKIQEDIAKGKSFKIHAIPLVGFAGIITFNEVQSIFEKIKSKAIRKDRVGTTTHLYSSFLQCSVCGKKLRHDMSSDASVASYYCKTEDCKSRYSLLGVSDNARANRYKYDKSRVTNTLQDMFKNLIVTEYVLELYCEMQDNILNRYLSSYEDAVGGIGVLKEAYLNEACRIEENINGVKYRILVLDTQTFKLGEVDYFQNSSTVVPSSFTAELGEMLFFETRKRMPKIGEKDISKINSIEANYLKFREEIMALTNFLLMPVNTFKRLRNNICNLEFKPEELTNLNKEKLKELDFALRGFIELFFPDGFVVDCNENYSEGVFEEVAMKPLRVNPMYKFKPRNESYIINLKND